MVLPSKAGKYECPNPLGCSSIQATVTSYAVCEPAFSPPHSSGDTPQRPDADCCRNLSSFRVRRSGAPATIPARVRSLRSETAWFRAISDLWRFVAPATSRQDRTLSQAPGATPAALPRSHRRRLLPLLTAVAYTPLPHLRADRARLISGTRSSAAGLAMLPRLASPSKGLNLSNGPALRGNLERFLWYQERAEPLDDLP